MPPNTPALTPSTAAEDPRRSPLAQAIGRHHFAHLRAVAQGIAVGDSARRYLGVDHGKQATAAHRETVDRVRAVARRHHESAWRLIGLRIQSAGEGDSPAPPSLDEFIESHRLDGFSEAEVAELFAEAYPADARAARRQRLHQRQLELLRRLEDLAAETPSPTDSVYGWFNETLAEKLVGAGFVTLSDLSRAVRAGGRWYAGLPGIGIAKARRVEGFLAALLPAAHRPAQIVYSLERTPSLFAPPATAVALPERAETELHTLPPLLDARDDTEAIRDWIKARAGSDATKRIYAREALRLRLWLLYERGGKILAQTQVNDCLDYIAFLENIPDQWISRVHASPGQPGWAPFHGQLSHASRKQAIVILAGLYAWLRSAQYLPHDPWVLVNRKFGDDHGKRLLDTRSFSEEAIAAVLAFIDAQPPSPARSRMRFLVRFNEAVGLRASELLGARLANIQNSEVGWMIQVNGKGSKERLAALPLQALQALDDYLRSRSLTWDTAPRDTPLVASTLDPMKPVGYTALYDHVRLWLRKAVMASDLPIDERLRLARASTHWLRHTFGARAVAREVPLDVIQAQMGHASITTTMMYGRAPLRRRVEHLGKAFS